nr:permease prefix domain 1-containing protein [Leucobacter chinensis]
MFSAYPQTPRLLEAKLELRAMMEDAYTGFIGQGHSENEAVGQVIRDFGNLEELAPVLGITTDIGASVSPSAPSSNTQDQATHPAAPRNTPITLDEAKGYAQAQKAIRFRVSAAIAFFVLSPIAIITLPVASETNMITGLSPSTATFVGILILLALVAIGVITLVTTSRETEPYRRVREHAFAPNHEVAAWAQSLAKEHENGRIRALQIAISLWILSPTPVIAAALLIEESPEKSFWVILAVAALLCFVAAGLAVLLPAAWAHTVAETLSRGTEYARTSDLEEAEHSITGVIASFYWPLLTAIFLAWGFIGHAWHIAWVIWPIGAVLFGAIAAGTGAIDGYRKSRR